MKRLHLFEFEDQSWFPKIFRDLTTDYLRHSAARSEGNLYEHILPVLKKGLAKSHTEQIVDLASGGGGALISLNDQLKKNYPGLKVLLTDLYPNLDAFRRIRQSSSNIDYISSSVDAANVPSHLKGLRTQFLSFHHFKPRDARRILQNALDSGCAIMIVEDQDRSLSSFLCELYAPVGLLLTAPVIKPFKLSRLIFTYLLPIIPLTLLWDGIVSCLRTYSLKEMDTLINRLDNKDAFHWESGRVKPGMRPLIYLLGTPKMP